MTKIAWSYSPNRRRHRNSSATNGVDSGISGQGAKGVNRQRATGRGRDRIPLCPESPIVFLNARDMPLQRRVQRDALRAENQLMKVLPVRRLDRDARTDVRGDKGIVENGDTRQRGRPAAVLKDKRCAGKGEDDVRRVCGAKPPTLVDKGRLARAERT